MTETNLPTPPTAKNRLVMLLNSPAIKKKFDDMLGKRSAQFTSSILSVVSSNKALSSVEPMSIILAAAMAASMDLPVNQSLGFAWIVPYKGVAQFQIGWKGYVQLALRSGQYKTINATEIYEGQIIDDNPFTGEMLFQRERVSDTVVGYLLYFKLLNGFEKKVYITREDTEKHAKKYSKAYQSNYGPWKDDFDAMALKTVVKNGLAKWGILSIEMQTAIESDQGEVIEGQAIRYPDAANGPVEESAGEEPPKKKTASRMKSIVTSEPPPTLPPEERFPFEQSDGDLSDRVYAQESDK